MMKANGNRFAEEIIKNHCRAFLAAEKEERNLRRYKIVDDRFMHSC